MAPPRAKAKTGRPSKYSGDLATVICERLIEGESLRAICEDEQHPSKKTVLLWVAEHDEFRDQYARARELSAESDADDVAHFARQAARGEIEPAAATAAINGLKWSAGKRAPKKYGEKITAEHTGPDGGPIQSTTALDVSRLTEDQLRALASIKLSADA